MRKVQHGKAPVGLLLLVIGVVQHLQPCAGFASVLPSIRLQQQTEAYPSCATCHRQRQSQYTRRVRVRVSSTDGSSTPSSPQRGEGPTESAPAAATAAAAPKSRTAQESEMFDWLADSCGVHKKVSLDSVKSGGYRGCVKRFAPVRYKVNANRSVQLFVPRGAAQIMLEVPSVICLWSTREGVVSGLHGQTDMCWEAAGDLREPVSDANFDRGLTWDVRLALALMEATADMQVGGKFWNFYGRLLPPPHTVTVPFCLPERLLVQLHNEGMAARARKQITRLRSLFPVLMQTLLSHPHTAVYAKERRVAADAEESDTAPMALAWAFAMVRSRALAAGDDRFAFVPFLDMANHDFAPSTNFTYEEPGVFRLRALRDIAAGEEATISYGRQLDAEQLMVQYGFPAALNTPLARPLLDAVSMPGRATSTESVDAAKDKEAEEAEKGKGSDKGWGEARRRALMDELLTRGQQRFSREAGGNSQDFEIMVRRALPLIPSMATTIIELSGKGEEHQGARAYLEDLQAYRCANFPTTEEQDKELLSYCLGGGRGKVDQRLADVIRYRIGRKQAHTIAANILEEFLMPSPLPEALPAEERGRAN